MAPKKGKDVSYKTNDLVFAKVKGYPCWPACVSGPKDERGSKYEVFFYGTYETATVKKEEMWRYTPETKARFGKSKAKGFAEALNEIENDPESGMLKYENAPSEDKVPLEGGVSGNTLLEESGLEQSSLDQSSMEAEEASEATEPETSSNQAEEEAVAEEPAPPSPAPAPSKPTASKKGAKSKAAPPSKVKEEPEAAAPAAKPVAKRAATKRKAPESTNTIEGSPSSSAPAAKQPRFVPPDTSTPVVTEEKTSRSGRVIKPKKFDDEGDDDSKATIAVSSSASNRGASTNTNKVDEGGKNNAPAKKTEATNRKLWVNVKATSDSIEIDLDKNRPFTFDSKEQEIEWDRKMAKEALKLKELVESGQLIPDEIRKRLEAKVNRTPEEEAILTQGLEIANHNEKLRWISVEQKIFELDIAVRMALHYQEPDMSRCLSLLEELQSLAIEPLMLKKHPDIIATLRKMRKYVGPIGDESEANNDQEDEIQQIRIKANEILEKKFQPLFEPLPENTTFAAHFRALVDQFRTAVGAIDKNKLAQIVVDPTMG